MGAPLPVVSEGATCLGPSCTVSRALLALCPGSSPHAFLKLLARLHHLAPEGSQVSACYGEVDAMPVPPFLFAFLPDFPWDTCPAHPPLALFCTPSHPRPPGAPRVERLFLGEAHHLCRGGEAYLARPRQYLTLSSRSHSSVTWWPWCGGSCPACSGPCCRH